MTEKIIEYRILHHSANALNVLEAAVVALIDEGWQPYGVMHSARIDNAVAFVQAMVKYGE